VASRFQASDGVRLGLGRSVGELHLLVELKVSPNPRRALYASFGGYVRSQGARTSLSTAIVAGVAATLLFQERDLTPAQVIARLKKTSVFAPEMKGKIGGGRLDMANLFSAQ
jgi:hypothetical protein